MTTANVHTENSFREGGHEYAPGFATSALPNYTFNAKELDEETGMYYYEARYYNPPVFTSRDPMFEKYFWMTSYAYCANNPMKYVDPTGMLYDESQRRAAIAKANEYEMKNRVDVTKPSGKGNSYNTYKLGAKGNPGQAVDCSGLTSACIVAGGEPDPVGKYSGGGVSQTVQGTEKIDDVNDVEEGNLIVFNNQKHIGIIIEKIYDKENNIIGFKMIHSSGDPARGYSGPNETSVMLDGSDYWGKRIDGIYKWDTIPDRVIQLKEVIVTAKRVDNE